ncbi:MAG: hypothetical protein LDLANPLL_01828 [Turneriella sp.]|nr:hypothetical protein [Turneriella sp.]
MIFKNHFAKTILVLGFFTCSRPSRPPENNFPAIFQANERLLIEQVQNVAERNIALKGLRFDISTINFFDFDHTLADTTTPVPVATAAGAKKTIDPRCLPLQAGDRPDFSVFDAENTYSFKPIIPSLTKLRAYAKDPQNLNIIITARGGRRSLSMIQEYLWKLDAEPDLVLPLHVSVLSKNLWAKFNLPANMDKEPNGYKKPLVMASVIKLLLAHGAKISTVRYFEDTDSYMAVAMKYLPPMFPEIEFHFYDYVNPPTKTAKYTEVAVASARGGILFHPDNLPYTNPEIYSSHDCKIQ